MGKVRVYELAKELNSDSKKIIEVLASKGVVVKNHMGVLDDNQVSAVKSAMGGGGSQKGDFKPAVKRIKKEVVEAEKLVVEDIKVEAPKVEVKQETPKATAPKAEAPKPEVKPAPKAEPKVEAPKVEAPKTEAPKVEAKPEVKPEPKVAPKVEAPKVDAPKSEAPKSESKPAEAATAPASAPAQKPADAPAQNNSNRPQYNNNNQNGNRPQYNNNRQGGYNNNNGGQRPYNNNNQNGDRPQYNNNRPQGGYNNNNGGQRPYNNNNQNGDRPQYNNNRPQGGYNNNNGGQRPYNNNNQNGDRPQYNNNRPQGGYNNNNGGQRPYNNNNQNGDRPQYNNNRPQGGYNNNNGGQRQGGYNNNGGGQRPQGGYNNNNGFNNNRSQAAAPAPEFVAAPVVQKQDTRRPERKKEDYNSNNRYGNDKYNNRGGNKNRPRNKYKEAKRTPVEVAPATPKKIVIGEYIILSELAKSMHKTASEVIKKLFEMGTMATINQELDSDTATLIADEFGVEVEVRQEKIVEILEEEAENPKDLKERPPVVTVMGHVDHGKTSLLDAIRKTSVISTEAGGITQHIGAYQTEISGKKITFLDTPGHEAFTSMRARGAQVTDITILVVAADDGIMPQTIEAINHAKAAEVPIIVAINKMDKPGANPDRVMQQLTEHGLVSEAWGGDVIMVPISAKRGDNIETLLEMVLLVAEVAELKASPKCQARGTVIEAKLDKARGPVVTLLVQKGTLKMGETFVAGSVFGKVRAMKDDKNKNVKAAGPSTPVEILGFSEVPEAGEVFMAIKDASNARYAAQIQAIKKREEDLRRSQKVTLDDLFSKISEGEVKDLNVLIKADVRGSVEAIAQSLSKLSTDEVKVRIIHQAVGAISESDIMLADASNAIVIGFNVRPAANAKKAADKAGVDVRLYSIIYDAIESVKQAMVGLLDPEYVEVAQGQAEIRSVIKVPKIGLIAGAYITEGKVTRHSEVRLVREGVVIHTGKLASLKRFKDDVKEVLYGFECGICIENWSDIKEGDVMEAYIMEETERKL